MFRFADVKAQLAGVGAEVRPGPPGYVPDLPQGGIVVASILPGPGQGTDATTDIGALTIRVVGPQGDYDATEDLAWACDRALRRDDTGPWGLRTVAYCRRQGGGPGLDHYDIAARRWHFTSSYLIESAAEVPGT